MQAHLGRNITSLRKLLATPAYALIGSAIVVIYSGLFCSIVAVLMLVSTSFTNKKEQVKMLKSAFKCVSKSTTENSAKATLDNNRPLFI